MEWTKITLQYLPKLAIADRSKRQKELVRLFGRTRSERLQLDMDSVSVSGQLVEGKLLGPIDDPLNAALLSSLKVNLIRVDPLIEHSLVW